MPLLHTLLHRYDHDGPRTFLLNLWRMLLRRTPARPTGIDHATHPFDLARQTDTSGYLPGSQLARGPLTWRDSDFYNTAYYGISPSTLRQALTYLPEPVASYTFVDIGCGKGRALLVAAELPFAHLLGVELSPQLCEVARQNTQPDSRIRILQHDAATAPLPEAPLVVFLYHPFLAPVLRRFLRHLEHQPRTHPLYLLYANPSYPSVLARFTFLEQVWDYGFPLSAEDAQADRYGQTLEHYTLYRARR